jgi:hypothetical protein
MLAEFMRFQPCRFYSKADEQCNPEERQARGVDGLVS